MPTKTMNNMAVNRLNIALPDGNGIRPPLKWAGGKRWLVPLLRPIWKKHKQKRLVEPFCGGLAVTLGLMPEQALLNDINNHAINFYRQLQKGLKVTLAMINAEEPYYKCREQFNKLIVSDMANTKEASQLFYYLNRTGYNGLCRFNKQGMFNVPFGCYAKINYAHDFSAYKNIFANWTFQSNDFEQMKVKSGDFIYADPPYDVDFTQYTKEGFNWQDQVRLTKWLAKHDGPVVLSNQATKRIIELYEDLNFKITILDAPRSISCTGNRNKTQEVLAAKGV